MFGSRLLTAALVLAAACGDDAEDQPCDVAANTGCNEGRVCEQVIGGEPTCFAPVEARGRVFDLADNRAISGARIFAVDVDGAAASSVAVSKSDGTYALPLPSARNSDGTPAALAFTLRSDAAGYQTFPAGARTALPLDVAAATVQDEGFVLQSAVTDIGLLAAPGAGAGSLRGKVEVPPDHAGVLVVAEITEGAITKGFSSIAARDGNYTIFNLAPGRYAVRGYAKGHVYVPADVDVAAATELDLALSTEAAGSVAGGVQLVNAGGATVTSAVLFVESTFDPTIGRGVQPPGLRTGNVSSAFTIAGVPPGSYVVVAAFENDNLVRDPNRCISGTADVHVEVTAGQAAPIANSFKVTGALAIMSPGATGAEAVTAPPTLRWADDSSEDDYLVEVFDAFGQLAWMTTVLAPSSGDPFVAYAGPFAPKSYYQWRATSRKGACNLSRTEDLRGVFYTQ